MIKRVLCLAVVAALAVTLIPHAAQAQAVRPGGTTSKARVFGGFSYLAFSSSGSGEDVDVKENLFGLQGNLTYYFHERVGFGVDGSFNTGSVLPGEVPEGVTSADLTQTALLFGPRFVLVDNGQFVAEAFATIGWAIGSVDVRGTNENDLPVFERLDDTVFASSFGANFDVMFGEGNWGMRLAQIELLVMGYDQTLTNFRYAGGIVGTF